MCVELPGSTLPKILYFFVNLKPHIYPLHKSFLQKEEFWCNGFFWIGNKTPKLLLEYCAYLSIYCMARISCYWLSIISTVFIRVRKQQLFVDFVKPCTSFLFRPTIQLLYHILSILMICINFSLPRLEAEGIEVSSPKVKLLDIHIAHVRPLEIY